MEENLSDFLDLAVASIDMLVEWHKKNDHTMEPYFYIGTLGVLIEQVQATRRIATALEEQLKLNREWAMWREQQSPPDNDGDDPKF